ncbi:putative nicotinamide N-methyase [Desulfitispora alkaliphila]
MLDVRGGPLTYANAFAQQGAVVTILDLPEVIDMMRPKLNPSLSISMEKGDFTKGLPKGPFDVVYLGNIYHIYGEKENRKLFCDAASELQSGGRMIINDFVRGTGPESALFAYEQYKKWLQDAGFSVPIFDEVSYNQLIIATKQ